MNPPTPSPAWPPPQTTSGGNDIVKGLLALAGVGVMCLASFGAFMIFAAAQVETAEGGTRPGYATPLLIALIAGGVAGLSALILLARQQLRARAAGKTWLVGAAIMLALAPVQALDETRDVAAYAILLVLGTVICTVLGRFAPRREKATAQPVVWPWVVLCALPWVARGALGSLLDGVLAAGVALCLGFVLARLDAILLQPVFAARAGYINTLLHGATLGVLAMMLCRAFGFQGHAMLLMAVVPVLGVGLAAVSRRAQGNAISPVAFLAAGAAAAPLAFVDAKEFNLLLGGEDMPGLIAGMSAMAFAVALVVALLLWLAPAVLARAGLMPRMLMGLAATLVAGVLWFFVGNPGMYNDRIFVILKSKADLAPAAALPTREARNQRIYELLTAHANGSQAGLRAQLSGLGVRHTPYYLVNAIEIDSPLEGGALLRVWLQTRPEVDRVLSSPRHKPLGRNAQGLPFAAASTAADTVESAPAVTWGLQEIEADRVWREMNVRGAGVVVGNTDSGVDGAHVALRDTYRGRGAADDFNWFDPWGGQPKPVDYGSHGTHTMGTVLGKNNIGVAPEAQWIGCANLARNLGNPGVYLACMQFVFAPHPQQGDPFTQGKPALGAHIVNNSWGCPPVEGCDANVYVDAMAALKAAGIFMAVSAGNSGSACSTVESPPAIYADAFTVGAIDSDGDMASFSSRGPVTVDGSGRTKPEIVAPGVAVLSSVPRQKYEANQGTSMAGPHVAGVVALMWSANPKLIGNVDRTQQILRETAAPYSGRLEIACAGSGGDPKQSNVHGYGVVNAYQAVKRAIAER